MSVRILSITAAAATVAGLAVAYASTRDETDTRPITESATTAVAANQVATGFEWFWAISGPVAADAGSDLSVDAAGNVFLAGSHGGLDMDKDGVVDFTSGGVSYEGAANSLIMKLNRGPSDDRVRLRWMRSPRNPADRSQTRIAVDNQGGAYVIGAFAQELSFEDGPTLPGAGGNDGFIARYDGEGSVTWARVFGGPGSDAAYDVAGDQDGNAYLVGVGVGTFPLDDRGAEFRATGERSSVLVSYAPDGAVRWFRVFPSGAPLAFRLGVAPNGDVYATGELEGAADFDGDGTVDLPAPGNRSGFVARFDPDGNLLSAWSTPVPAQPAFTPNGDVVLGSAMGGPMEDRYGPADFTGDGRADIELKGGGPTGTWVARYSPDGELRWVRSYSLEMPADIQAQADRIVVSGNYKGVRDLDEDGEAERVDRTVDPSLETDLAILILSTEDGRPQRVWTAPGPGNDWANAVAFLPNEPALVVTGAIQLTADFTGDGEDGEGWALCEHLGDIFFAQYRLEPSQITLSASLYEVKGEGLKADLTWSGATSTDVQIYRGGELLMTTANSGAHTDALPRGSKPPIYYRICEVGTTVCSTPLAAQF